VAFPSWFPLWTWSTEVALEASGPDFLGIGSTRCGTTSIYEYLRSHPDVWLPPIKELHYWDIERVRRVDGRSRRLRFGANHARRLGRPVARVAADLDFMCRYTFGRRNDRWYRGLFCYGGKATMGEITASYCHLPIADISAIHQHFPNLRLILILRDPIERAWSSAAKVLGRQAGTSLTDVSETALWEFFDRPNLKAASDYLGMIRRWQSVFGPEQLFVGSIEEMAREPDVFFGNLGKHLGVDSAPLIETYRRIEPANTTVGFRSTVPPLWEQRLARQFHAMVDSLIGEIGLPVREWQERISSALAQEATSGSMADDSSLSKRPSIKSQTVTPEE
jgi:hypothetical protein